MNAPGTHCPRCGAAAERGQLMCLECGSRIALVYRRPPSWKVPAAITLIVVLVLGVVAATALAALSDDADREVAAAPPRPKTQEAASEPARERPKTTASTERRRTEAKSRERAKEPQTVTAATTILKRGALWRWPSTLEGFTVVINSTEDRASATTFARSAAKSKPAKLGVLDAADFKTLPKGFFVVYAGYYDSRGKADRATRRLERKYKGAFTQAVER